MAGVGGSQRALLAFLLLTIPFVKMRGDGLVGIAPPLAADAGRQLFSLIAECKNMAFNSRREYWLVLVLVGLMLAIAFGVFVVECLRGRWEGAVSSAIIVCCALAYLWWRSRPIRP
ncbi:hypothetical protein PLANPX_0459 [Lacipirellula parvula]|uniref:Uncharacterized protein n=1 Tax=Lacipirellula parvula TaxID=2650471 RepID=A0A5K7X4Y3_9BACT|nr:hypothetical protein PLANPX_0459 [Lacipirellula parvula]